MENSNLKWTSMIAAIVLSTFMASCNNAQKEQDTTAEDAENTETIEGTDMQETDYQTTVDTDGEPRFLAEYMNVKNALVNDDHEKVKEAASKLQNSLENSKVEQEQRTQLKEKAKAVAEAQDIESQREAFEQLSQQLYQVVQKSDMNNKTLYWQHCPMAMNNKGANWLSYEEQVQNPYMGQRMPKCGSVKETIN